MASKPDMNEMVMRLGMDVYFFPKLCSFLSFWNGYGDRRDRKARGSCRGVFDRNTHPRLAGRNTHDLVEILTMFGVVQSECTIKGKTSTDERRNIGSICPEARKTSPRCVAWYSISCGWINPAREESKLGAWSRQPAILIVSRCLGWWLFDAIAHRLPPTDSAICGYPLQ